MDGERCTLALWFTRDNAYDEDNQLIKHISGYLPRLQSRILGGEKKAEEGICLDGSSSSTDQQSKGVDFHVDSSSLLQSSCGFSMPVPASSSMYWIDFGSRENEKEVTMKDTRQESPEGKLGYDVRVSRLTSMGFEFSICSDLSGNVQQAADSLESTLKLKYKGMELPYIFSNSIHALQVIFFSEWKKTVLKGCSSEYILEKEHDRSDSSKWSRASSTYSSNRVGHRSSDHETGENMDSLSRQELSCSALLVDEWEHYLVSQWYFLIKCYPAWEATRSLSAIGC